MESAIVVVIGYETKLLMKKICRRAKNRESRRRQRQLGAAENRAAGPTARRCAPQKSSRHGAKRRGGLYSWLVDARATAHDKAWQ